MFGKEKSSEDIIFEQVEKISKEKDKIRLLNLLINVNRKCAESSNFDLTVISSHKVLARCRSFMNGGFYQIISYIDLPFYPGDVLIFSHEENYQKGDILQYFTIDGEKGSDEKVVYHYLYFDYKSEDGLVTRTLIPGDEKKYTVQSLYVLGRLVNKIEFGSPEWKKFISSEGIAYEKIIDEINSSAKFLSENDFVTKEASIQELNRRKLILTK